LVFASEIKALLASGLIAGEVDPIALRLLLTFGSVYQPRTILSGVKMLLPGQRLILEKGRERLEYYWSLESNRQPYLRKQHYEGIVEEMTRVLDEAVHLQLVSDVPLGAFLSGGVDSSILVAMMVKAANHRVKTFSVGFEAEGADIDESHDAQRIAHFLHTDHTHVLVRGKDVRDRIRHIASALDEPSVDGVNSYFVSLAAKQGVTVALSGTGGDELFAGYPWFLDMMSYHFRNQREPYKAIAKSLFAAIARHPILDPLILTRGGRVLDAARNWIGFLSRYANHCQIFRPLEAAKLLSPQLRRLAQAGRSAHHDLCPIDELSRSSVIERVTGLCLRGYTSNQLLRDIDAVSMAHSLEVRVPYLDPIVVDTALSLADNVKLDTMKTFSALGQNTYRETGAKRILIDAGRSLLPENIDLQPKRGFAMPFEAWLRGPLRDIFSETLSEKNIMKRGFLDAQGVFTIKEGFLQGRRSWAQPWLLMMLELWCQEVLDQPLNIKRRIFSGRMDDIVVR
jgi:asparagine synthase (glutamine-hydrolysing)